MGVFFVPDGYTRIELVHAFSGVADVHTRMNLVSAYGAGFVLDQLTLLWQLTKCPYRSLAWQLETKGVSMERRTGFHDDA